MATLTETRLITGEELLTLPDLGPCELIDGRIVRMSPVGDEHAILEFRFGRWLGNFAESKGYAWVMGGEIGIYTRRKPDRVRGTDVVVISKQRLPRWTKGYLSVAPELVIEIMSPHDKWEDIRQKVAEYFAIGVERVWVVEPAQRTVTVFRSSTDLVRLGEDDTLKGEGLLEGFELPLSRLFESMG